MSTRGKILAGVAVIFFVCLIVWVVRTTPTEPPPMEKFEPPTVMEYEGNTLTEERDGKIIWELTCDKMRVDSITQDMELTNVRGKFYDEEKTWELTAQRGIYDRTDKVIYVEGDVFIRDNEGSELRSEELSWLTEKETLTATGEVRITKDDGAKLNSDELIWFSKEERITATGNVYVINDDGAKLLSDKLEWFISEEKVIATGNVKIAKEDMRAFGDLAYSDNGFKHFGLMGHARILKSVKEDDESMKF